MPKVKPSVPAGQVSLGQAPLVHRLSELGLASSRPPKRVFSDRLAELVDISDAIALADFFKGLDRIQRSRELADNGDPQTLFKQHKAGMSQVIDASFDELEFDAEDAPSPRSFRLPLVDESTLLSSEAPARYQRFYALHQSELERRTAALKAGLYRHLRGTSDELAQLAALEGALERMLLNYSRRCLATLPKHLTRRFETLRQAQRDLGEGLWGSPEDWLAEGGWLARFYQELQTLLHAELELRLQPLAGMLLSLSSTNIAQDNP